MRIFLFLMTNVAVMSVLFISTSLLGVQEYVGGQQNYFYLLIISAVFGFSGSFISLLLSKWMAKKSMRLEMIDANNPKNDFEEFFVYVVKKQAKIVGIKTPEMAYYSGAPNAFATGAFKNKALVAVSDQLVQNFADDPEALESVIGHEISHIA